ncbi:hypothetical protein Pcar_0840 [Syntrophotalea carbinolica DSM 2380]|uniref:DUF5320 domain-containing protein n=1 Tax=Syntrophotalea carbinolica (strain DSM 2380 / NBRC 103641 / GraBd1) TaxID=338963 RepID=Q3A6B1_SYNC1|nr:DUF5320 domain-containing protein [Syntrophotalea carbinolica]ABA88096.1 hypothetical protein Pcar_0840 [Syntrophotalea carbinolica DSM 2380]
MPGGDRTGPQGYGPLTGRRMGVCAGYDMPNAAGLGRGRGGGRGLAMRRGCGGWGFPAVAPAAPVVPVAQASDTNVLKGQIDTLERSLAALKQQLEAMETRRGE